MRNFTLQKRLTTTQELILIKVRSSMKHLKQKSEHFFFKQIFAGVQRKNIIFRFKYLGVI